MVVTFNREERKKSSGKVLSSWYLSIILETTPSFKIQRQKRKEGRKVYVNMLMICNIVVYALNIFLQLVEQTMLTAFKVFFREPAIFK